MESPLTQIDSQSVGPDISRAGPTVSVESQRCSAGQHSHSGLQRLPQFITETLATVFGANLHGLGSDHRKRRLAGHGRI